MARIGSKLLADLSRRIAISLEAGIDERKIWLRESERSRGHMHEMVSQIAAAVDQGRTVGDAVHSTGSYFPPLFRELVALGDETGKSATVFRRMADHYEHRVQLRREFISGITWPLFQLGAAIFIVGFLIWILGVIADSAGDAPYDILGFGLQGHRGLLIYVSFIATMGGLVVAGYYLVRSGVAWIRPVELMVMRIPAVGNCLRTLAISRLAWTLGLTMEAGMDARRALPFAMQSTHSSYFQQHTQAVQDSVDRGDEAVEAFTRTGVFPDDFLDTLLVGEQSGKMDEAMLRLADQYQDRARAALATMTKLAGFVVWALVALVIISIIFRIVASYAGFIEGLANPR